MLQNFLDKRILNGESSISKLLWTKKLITLAILKLHRVSQNLCAGYTSTCRKRDECNWYKIDHYVR